MHFTRELWIEQEDFMEVPAPKFFRLRPGGEVRLKYAFIIRCEEVIKDANGAVVELRCSADLESKSGGLNAQRKVKGTIHWVSATHAIERELRLYDRLFTEADPEAEGRDFKTVLNPRSLEVVNAKLEPALAEARGEERFQFERLGYFALDPEEYSAGRHVFNRTITLKDAWAKAVGKI
jgi:glutaminyl-tRNA synthetase